jgi:ATP-binding cassette subfamily G (WHITE) protein 2 (SNQ2)
MVKFINIPSLLQPKLLLFLDEPTSGLDSQSAWGIMSFLRTLADNGQAILCTSVISLSLYSTANVTVF